MQLSIYRGNTNSIISEIPIFDTFMFSRSLMQENRITIPGFIIPDPLPIKINDYIIFKGVQYTINTVPDVAIDHLYNYTIVFEGPEYTMYDKILMHEGMADFPYFGTAREHLQLMVDNINELSPGYTIGTVEDTQPMFITYSNLSCRVGLNWMVENFKMEFFFRNKEINIVKQAGNVTTLTFEQGIFKGLYSLTRKYSSEKNIKTKVYGYGSTKNLPQGYRNGATRLVFNERFISRNTGIYGVKEGFYTDEEIFPTREGTISAVGPIDDETLSFTVTDSTLDFNLNTYKLPAVNGKISFLTGELTGEMFEVTSYNDSTKTMTCKAFTNTASIKLPSTAFKPAVGDKYNFIDIGLPETYVTAAELKLKNGTTIYTDQNSIPQFIFELAIDILNARDKGYDLNPGDIVRVINTPLGIDHSIRVTSVEHPISFPEILTNDTKYNVTIANFINYSITERITAAVITNREVIKVVDRKSVELARRNMLDFRDLQNLIFDPDGYFDPGKIKPLSIETYMLSVGAKSQNFMLSGVKFERNLGGDPNKLFISGGELLHLEVDIPGLGYAWVIPGFTFTGLNPLLPYYVYAKCSTTALTGTWEISTTPPLLDATPGYYNFNLGILYKVVNGTRGSNFTYGITTVVGGEINTGRIQDITGQNFWDLVSKLFFIGDDVASFDFGVTVPGELSVNGKLNATNAEFINLVVQNLRTKLSGRRVEISEVDNNIRLIDIEDKDILIIDENLDSETGGTYGAGMRIGRIGETKASLTSARGHFIYAADGSQLSFINDQFIFTEGTLQVNGLSNLHNVTFNGYLRPDIGDGEAYIGFTGIEDVRVGGDQFKRFKYVKGVLVSITAAT